MDDADRATSLTLDDHIAFARDYLESIKERPGEIRLARPALDRFLEAAAEALALQRDLAPKQRRGRPSGGMGEMMVRLIANGHDPLDALRITKRHSGGKSSTDDVLRAYSEARKKTPP